MPAAEQMPPGRIFKGDSDDGLKDAPYMKMTILMGKSEGRGDSVCEDDFFRPQSPDDLHESETSFIHFISSLEINISGLHFFRNVDFLLLWLTNPYEDLAKRLASLDGFITNP